MRGLARASPSLQPGLISAAAGIVLLLAPWGCAHRGEHPPLPVVSKVDLPRYMGLWYEIASYPNRFQKGCVDTRATYSLRGDGLVSVRNECRRGSSDEPFDVAEGVARVVERDTNAKLEVSFFWPFWGDYWILELGPEYEYAVIGTPSREYLWILSRTPGLDEPLLTDILERLPELSYDPSRLQRTPQSAAENAR